VTRFGVLLAIGLCTAACDAPPDESSVEQAALSPETLRTRAGLIRDAAAEMGVHNAALLMGIAKSETGLAHCWSEATYACKGPASSSCGDGPIIAGSADGPCANMQGGLGMFQFDAGTYAQTVAAYGPSILTIEGNTAQAVNFVIDRLPLEVSGTATWMNAANYMNQVPLRAGDPIMEEWSHFLACRYNGCCSTSTLCESRADGYRDNAIAAFNDLGADFWRTADRCSDLPDLIDNRSGCYVAGGDPRYWRHESTGYADTREWTSSTTQSAPANFARWLLRSPSPDRLHLEVHVTGGEATGATYTIIHAGMTDTVVVDQTQADGFVSLGEFDVEGTADEYVELGDNTGSSGEKLVFDALRITSLNRSGPGVTPTGGGDEGGCSTTGRGGSLGSALVLLALVRRRRR
jgi:hypothetical protein